MSLDTPLAIVIAFVVILLLGMAIGFTMGLAKGVLLGARFHTGRPVSPIPWILSAIGSGICLLVAIGTSIYSVYCESR